MKKNSVAYYNAFGGVYHERRLPKSTQFVAGAYLLVIGLVVMMISHGVSLGGSQSPVAKTDVSTQLVAHTQAVVASPAAAQPADPAPVVPPNETAQLASAVSDAISQNPATSWSVAIYDIQSKSWLLRSNAEQQMTSASLYKLYAAYGLSKKVPFAQWGSIQLAGHSLQDCVDLMIRDSDNTCGSAIGDYVGWRTIDVAIHAAGFTGTSLNLKTGPITNADNTTRFMASLYQGKLFDQPTTDFLLSSLKAQVYRSAIPAGCVGCTTYNKTGDDDSVTHDSAVVISGDRSYAVTIMSQGGTNAQIASIERAIQTVL